MSRTTALRRAAAALVPALAVGGAMADSGTFDQLPAPLTSTRQTIACTVTKESNESRLLAIKVASQSPTQPEETLDEEAFAPEPDPPVPQGTLPCHFDSTHWKHGETVTFRIYAKTPEDADWVLEATTTREVVNGFFIANDDDVAPLSDYDEYKTRWLALNWGELPGLNSATWSKADYVQKLPPCQGHLVMTHGTTAGLWLENPDEDVLESEVRANMGGTGPISRFGSILAGECGTNAEFLRAYLDEQKPLEVNRFIYGFKTCPMQSAAFTVGKTFLTQQNKGRCALKALEFAYGLAFADFALVNFSATMGWVGDPACRLRYLYDGTTNNTLAWKEAP